MPNQRNHQSRSSGYPRQEYLQIYDSIVRNNRFNVNYKTEEEIQLDIINNIKKNLKEKENKESAIRDKEIKKLEKKIDKNHNAIKWLEL